MSYAKKTSITLASGKSVWRNGHSRNIGTLPKGTRQVQYFVFDNSGKGRGGQSYIIITPSTNSMDLMDASRKA